jgi:hypothetical protein
MSFPPAQVVWPPKSSFPPNFLVPPRLSASNNGYQLESPDVNILECAELLIQGKAVSPSEPAALVPIATNFGGVFNPSIPGTMYFSKSGRLVTVVMPTVQGSGNVIGQEMSTDVFSLPDASWLPDPTLYPATPGTHIFTQCIIGDNGEFYVQSPAPPPFVPLGGTMDFAFDPTDFTNCIINIYPTKGSFSGIHTVGATSVLSFSWTYFCTS